MQTNEKGAAPVQVAKGPVTVKTIDIVAKEWFDKINGNSYFSARATINFGMEGEQTIYLPFQYGYGDHYTDMAFQELEKAGIFTDVEHYSNGGNERLWKYCSRHNIIKRCTKYENCKKAEVKEYGIKY